MPRTQPILPQADASCGKLFFADRRTADGHRIALEVWNRATGRVREGHRLTVYRCKRCAGYHIALKPIDRIPPRPLPQADVDRDERGPQEEWDQDVPPIRRISLTDPAW